MLLKIYCENIVIEFLNCHFFFIYYFSFLSFYHSYVSFLLFFLLVFLHHTRIPIYPFPLPFFSPPSTFQDLPLSFFLQLSFNLFFFPTHYLAFSVIRNGERGSERKNRWVRWLCFATAARLPPHYHLSSSPPPGWVRSACSFFFFFSYLLVLIQLYFKNWTLFCVLCLDYVRRGENERKKEIRRRDKELI